MPDRKPVAVITGASQGLGLVLAHELASLGWSLVLDARDAERLERAVASLPGGPHRAIAGDVTDPAHRRDVVDGAAALGGADVLVNNASTLGASPLPALADLDTTAYLRVLEVNLVAPVALAAALARQLRTRSGRVVNVTSDAAVEAYPTWGGYGSSKAGLDHASRVLAAEEPSLRVYAVDPGDMRTQMHQDAFPGADISDRPEPEHAVPALVRLLVEDLPGGRYRAEELLATQASSAVPA
ncbi:SDR family NAD(P)-dependent oxidoreductase [Nocardioides sp.]|uniref:SDR family NAD(P)-dependent oxidoreductase n=1 Tax=Nocardioides sp. TaxID=35761 RepID=UPI0031FE7755|nr:short-chain dehydrogenase/reductase [Nocardioides sp.]